MRKWEKKIKECEQRLEELNKELKEKEQENRISKLKIKEMRRLLKHN
jgi:Arc/MetJ-type ribon-helix-helix transcriptional regulator